MRMGEGRAKSKQLFDKRKQYQVAAHIWSDGVPWVEALKIAERAFQQEGAKGKGKGKAKGKRSSKGAKWGKTR